MSKGKFSHEKIQEQIRQKNLKLGSAQKSSSMQQSVYKRIPAHPLVLSKPLLSNYFVTSSHSRFAEVVDGPYKGFQLEVTGQYPQSFSERYQKALIALDDFGLYQFDMTQPAGLGTKVARTFVSRCLVGDAGMTYKYLGLRMFAYPWNEGATGATAATVEVGALNDVIRARAHALNLQSGKTEFGTSNFNLTLINRCYPTEVSARTFPLKKEPLFGRDLCSVSWHADSSLDHYSTIAVFHFEQNGTEDGRQPRREEDSWRVALKVQVNAEGPQQGRLQEPQPVELQPPIALSLPSECIYYMLDDFNHHHQHAVLAGNTHRFASTHRVSRVEGHSYGYISQKVVQLLSDKLKADSASIRRTVLLAEEVESEWLRQFYIQGERFFRLHSWWHVPMATLLQQLSDIELRIVKQFAAVLVRKKGIIFKNGGERTTKQEKKMEQLSLTVSDDSSSEMAALLQERWNKRRLWLDREADPIYNNMAEDLKPKHLDMEGIDIHWKNIDSAVFSCDGKDNWQNNVVSALRA